MKLVFAMCLATVTSLILAGCSREHEEYIEGQGQAERDLAKGEFKVAIVDGSNMPAFGEYSELLRKRYRIGWCVYSLPANPSAAEAWVRGYNEVAAPRIEREIGSQILKQTMADAETLHGAAIAKH
jgi:hypothetical protein